MRTPPRTGVHFVDADRSAAIVRSGAIRGQCARRERRCDLARSAGSHFAFARERIGFARQQRAVAIDHFEFIQIADGRMRYEDFPHACGMAQAHRMTTTVPGVERTDHADPTRVRRPDREQHAVDLADAVRMRA